MKFPFSLWLFNGSVIAHVGELLWSSKVNHLSEPVQYHIIQIFIYRGVYYLTGSGEGRVWFLVQFGREPFFFDIISPYGNNETEK